MTTKQMHQQVGQLVATGESYSGQLWVDGWSAEITILPNAHRPPHTRQPDYFAHAGDGQRLGPLWRNTTATGAPMLSGEVKISGYSLGIIVLPNRTGAGADYRIFARSEDVAIIDSFLNTLQLELFSVQTFKVEGT